MTTHYTEHRLTNAMLQRMAAMHNRQPHKYGTALQAILDRGGLIRERVPRCPECGDEYMATTDYWQQDKIPHGNDWIGCKAGHYNKRRGWGGCYQFDWELTEAGRQALAAARQEGW